MTATMYLRPHTRHPTSEYRPILRMLIEQVRVRSTYEQISAALNRADLKTGTGRAFSASAVGGILHRLRRKQGYHFFALAELVLTKDFSHDDANVLLR